MGYVKHNAIVVTSWNDGHIRLANEKAKTIFDIRMVGEITGSIINGQSSFFIAPDGSKEGWKDSNSCDTLRNEFVGWINSADLFLDWVEIRFGGDDDNEKIVRSRHNNPELL